MKHSTAKVDKEGKVAIAFTTWVEDFTTYNPDKNLYEVEVETHVVDGYYIDDLFLYWKANVYKNE